MIALNLLLSLPQAGVGSALVVAEHQGEFRRILQLSEQFAGFVMPCLGIHPVQVMSVSLEWQENRRLSHSATHSDCLDMMLVHSDI